MCSRYSLTSPPEAVRAWFKCGGEDVFPPRYNIAPTDPVHIVRMAPNGARELILVRWGLIPGWVKDPRTFATLINAKAETVADKASFRAAWRHRRCLVPTDGFYEWTGERGHKQPHLIRRRDRSLFAFAGLWESWLGADGSEFDSMAILTTAANAEVAAVHDRMPVILAPDDYERWLTTGSGDTQQLGDLLRPARDGVLDLTAVTRKVNNPRAEGPDLQEPAQGGLL